MIQLKTEEQIQGIRVSGMLLSRLLDELNDFIKPGITTKKIDNFVNTYITDHKGIPTFLNYGGFPASACISVNDTVIHGIPDNTVLKEGDIVGCDVGITLNGYISDSCRTYPVGPISKDAEKLLEVTKASLEVAISAAINGNRIKDIGKAISEFIEPYGYGIVQDFCGHGVGLELHEDPQVSNHYPSHGRNPRIKPGMVLAIEPMINMGHFQVETLEDGWTVKTVDKSISAHFEHTVAVFEDRTEILTLSK